MNIKHYLDSTYLKTPTTAQLSEKADLVLVKKFIQEAINEDFKLIMLYPNHVSLAKKLVQSDQSKVLIGTVIDFPVGENSIEKKIEEAKIAIANGADELDFVCNYKAFKNNEIDLLKKEIFECTDVCLQNNKTIKWIIEVAALTEIETIKISVLIKNIVLRYFNENQYNKVFIKSSTGFYKTEHNLPAGATLNSIKLMLAYGYPLPIKAAGGIKSFEDAIELIQLGVQRIGTSSANKMSKNIEITDLY